MPFSLLVAPHVYPYPLPLTFIAILSLSSLISLSVASLLLYLVLGASYQYLAIHYSSVISQCTSQLLRSLAIDRVVSHYSIALCL